MTMQQVLEGIKGLGERFDRHSARLAALERETGMADEDDDDDEAKKKAEEAMADDDPDKDPDKDRGRSTRTPGQTMTMTRAANPQGSQGKG